GNPAMNPQCIPSQGAPIAFDVSNLQPRHGSKDTSDISRMTDEFSRMESPRKSTSKTDASMRSVDDVVCVECGWKIVGSYSKDQPNKCELCLHWRWRLPKYGGSAIIHGMKCNIVNTCSLDSFLSILIFYYAHNWQLLYKQIGTKTSYELYLRDLLSPGSPNRNIDACKEDLIQRCYVNRLNIKKTAYDLENNECANLKELTNSASLLNFKIHCTKCSSIQSHSKTQFEAKTTTANVSWKAIIENIISYVGICKSKLKGERCAGAMVIDAVEVNAWFIPVDISLFTCPAGVASN
ncbi:hypothetical protein PENTCL1PPCAC_12868, partial [Pristionchus entomophagus]